MHPRGSACWGDPGGFGSLIVAGGEWSGGLVVGVKQWAEIRRMHFVAGLSIKEIARRTGRDRNTVRRGALDGAAELSAGAGGVQARSATFRPHPARPRAASAGTAQA